MKTYFEKLDELPSKLGIRKNCNWKSNKSETENNRDWYWYRNRRYRYNKTKLDEYKILDFMLLKHTNIKDAYSDWRKVTDLPSYDFFRQVYDYSHIRRLKSDKDVVVFERLSRQIKNNIISVYENKTNQFPVTKYTHDCKFGYRLNGTGRILDPSLYSYFLLDRRQEWYYNQGLETASIKQKLDIYNHNWIKVLISGKETTFYKKDSKWYRYISIERKRERKAYKERILAEKNKALDILSLLKQNKDKMKRLQAERIAREKQELKLTLERLGFDENAFRRNKTQDKKFERDLKKKVKSELCLSEYQYKRLNKLR